MGEISRAKCPRCHCYAEECFKSIDNKFICTHTIHQHNCIHCDFTLIHCEIKLAKACDIPIQVVCENTECILKDKLAEYQWKLKQAEGSIDSMKVELDAFRLMCLSPATMEQGTSNGKYSYFTNKSWLNARKALWEEKTSIETQLIFLDLFQNAAHAVADIVSKQKSGRLQINKEILERSHKEAQKVEAIRQGKLEANGNKEPKEVKKPMTQYERIVAANIKQFKCSKEDAEKMVEAMGIKK